MAQAEEPRKFNIVHGTERATGEKQLTGYVEGLLHMCKSYVGTGIYAMGAAIKYSGLILGPILTFVIAFIDLHCQHLLVRASEQIAMKEPNGEQIFPTFQETVRYSFMDSKYECLRKSANLLSYLTNVFLAMGCIGFCTAYCIFVSEHASEITEEYGWKPNYRIMLAICIIPIYLTTFLGSLRLLTPLNLIANFLMWIGIGICFYYTTTNMEKVEDLDLINIEEVPLFFGIVIFAFQNIGMVLPMRSELKNVNNYTHICGILNVSLYFVVTLYTILGVLAYWKFGDEISGSVFLNLPNDEELAQAVKGIIAFAVLLSFALQFYVLVEIIYPPFYEKYGPFKFKYLSLCAFRTSLVLFIYLLANISSNLGVVISLSGSISGSYCCIILPALLQISLGDLPRAILIKDIFLVLFGVVGAITGTTLALYTIIMDLVEPKSSSTVEEKTAILKH